MNTKIKPELNLTGSNDIIFKAIMLSHPNCLKAIMETLMAKKINKVRILNSELPKRQFIKKGKRLDAYLEASEEYIDVEVSNFYNETTKNRNLSYVCHIYCNSVKSGEDYLSYKKASIFNLVWGQSGEHLHTTGKLTDEYGNIISDMLNYHTHYMDNYMERYYNRDIEFIHANKYLIMLKLRVEELDELITLTERDEIVMEYKEALEEVTNDCEIAPFIEGERDREMWYKGSLKEAVRDATKEATEKGLAEGIEKGIEQGIERGMNEAKQVIAISLLSRGMELSEIASITNLSIEIIEELKNTIISE